MANPQALPHPWFEPEMLVGIKAGGFTLENVLGSGGLLGREEEVLALELENKPGVLGKMASRLKEKKVNLLYCYGTVGQASSSARFIMKAENNDQAIEALR